MNGSIPEQDWRTFKEVHATLLERHCAQTLEQLAALIAGKKGTSHEQYVRAYKLITKRDEELASAFDDFRRSTAVIQLVTIRRSGLLSDEHLSRFSEETRSTILAISSL